MVEEVHRAHNTSVRTNPIHRVSSDDAFFGLGASDPLKNHMCAPAAAFLDEEATNIVPYDALFEPKEIDDWEPLRQLPGWSRTSTWYSPPADDVHDIVADLLCFRQLADFSKLGDVLLWTQLMGGDRALLQKKDTWGMTCGGGCGVRMLHIDDPIAQTPSWSAARVLHTRSTGCSITMDTPSHQPA